MVAGSSRNPGAGEGPTEADLVAGARRGERGAFESLVRLHQERVFFLLRRSVAADEVEDLAQEAFLRAFEKIDRYRGEARFGTWLARIVRNLLIDRRRLRRRSPDRLGLAEETGNPGDVLLPDPSPGPEERVRLDAQWHRLDAALSGLGEKDRIAILLHDREGMRAGEVARVIGGTAGAVRVRLFRVRRRLRAILAEEESG